MGLGDLIKLLISVLQFPNEVSQFVALLQKTPEEKHDELVKTLKDEAAKFEATGRPSW